MRLKKNKKISCYLKLCYYECNLSKGLSNMCNIAHVKVTKSSIF